MVNTIIHIKYYAGKLAFNLDENEDIKKTKTL